LPTLPYPDAPPEDPTATGQMHGRKAIGWADAWPGELSRLANGPICPLNLKRELMPAD
jgi:hypothetical protein